MIGVLGAGQLGRMLALAGHPLGLRCSFLAGEADAPAAQVAPSVTGSLEDCELLERLFAAADVVTYESENMPLAAVQRLAERVVVHPGPRALESTQDRLLEKSLFVRLGIPTPRFVPVGNLAGLEQGLRALGRPAVLKTRRGGYDGRGQVVLRGESSEGETQVGCAWRRLGAWPLILEEFVPFDRELSLIGARGRDGATVFYPLVENRHADGVLRCTLAPAPRCLPQHQWAAEEYLRRLMVELDYVGVLTVEFFQVGDRLLANEAAPRVHNSGHWTIEDAETSQFENHLRAIAGLPLGSTAPRGHAAMVNLLGEIPHRRDLFAIEGAHVHLYGKTPQPGRKMGHVTITHADPEVVRRRLDQLSLLVPDAKAEAASLRRSQETRQETCQAARRKDKTQHGTCTASG